MTKLVHVSDEAHAQLHRLAADQDSTAKEVLEGLIFKALGKTPPEQLPRTEYQRELDDLSRMFPNGCPHCPSKLPPDPRDGCCGMCGRQLAVRR